MNSLEPPDLTAYALGELSPAEAARARQYLAENPEAAMEFAETQEVISAFRQHSSIPKRTLHPHQRQAVLNPAVRPVAPKARPISPPNVVRFARPSAFQTFAKLAAAACVTVGAFILGQKSAAPVVVSGPIQVHLAPSNATPTVKPAQDDKSAQLAQAPVKSPAPALVPAAPAPAPVTPLLVAANVEKPVSVTAVPASTDHAPAPQPPTHSGNFGPNASPLTAFTNASSQPEATVVFHPKLVKNIRQVFADRQIILSAPLSDSILNNPAPAPSVPKEHHRKNEQPALVIHSWTAKIASCPWDTSRRLVRIMAQIPIDQPAVEANDGDYRLVTKFDNRMVQGYRLVAEKHVPPSNGGSLATRIAWYEIIPGHAFTPAFDKPVSLGLMDIAYGKHNAAFDNNSLKLVDYGSKWTDERDDFVYETAMVGFRLLLQGMPNVGDLNYHLVLDIAERPKTEDVTGERARIVKAVQQAQRAAGL